MRKLRNTFKRPKSPWYLPRIEEERTLLKRYGLRRKKEIWKAQEILRKFRNRAKELNAVKNKEEETVLIKKLSKLGMLPPNSHLDDVLSMGIENVLDRRLQTIVFRSGLAKTPLHARQLITHGHVMINDKRVRFPSYIVSTDEEESIKLLGTPSKGD